MPPSVSTDWPPGLEGRPRSSAFLAGLAFACKLQTVFLLPVWAVLWMSRRVRFRDLLCFPAACVLAVLPALLLGKPLGDTLGVYFGQAAEYSAYLTLNAPSLYALLPARTQVDVAAAARLGIAAAFLLVLGCWGWLLLRRRNLSRRAIFLSAVVFAIGIPLLLPHMHDRYFFLADVLTLTWACIHPKRTSARFPHPAGVPWAPTTPISCCAMPSPWAWGSPAAMRPPARPCRTAFGTFRKGTALRNL